MHSGAVRVGRLSGAAVRRVGSAAASVRDSEAARRQPVLALLSEGVLGMATLTIRQLDERTHARLRRRAA